MLPRSTPHPQGISLLLQGDISPPTLHLQRQVHLPPCPITKSLNKDPLRTDYRLPLLKHGHLPTLHPLHPTCTPQPPPPPKRLVTHNPPKRIPPSHIRPSITLYDPLLPSSPHPSKTRFSLNRHIPFQPFPNEHDDLLRRFNGYEEKRGRYEFQVKEYSQ